MPDDFERSFWDDRFRRICPPCRCDRDRGDDRRDDRRNDQNRWGWDHRPNDRDMRDRDDRRRY